MAMLWVCSWCQHCSVRSWLVTTGWVIVFTWLLNTSSLVDALWCVLTCNRDLQSSDPFQWLTQDRLHTLPGSPMPSSIRVGAWWLFGFPGINLEYVSNSPSNVWIVTIPLGITTEINGPRSLHDEDNHDGVITHREPDILECEVKWALGNITTNKTSGGYEVPAELFQILKDDAAKVLHSLCQHIWKTHQWPQDWERSVFIPIPKKVNAKECSNYHTIALISHASKEMPKIFHARLQQYMNWARYTSWI